MDKAIKYLGLVLVQLGIAVVLIMIYHNTVKARDNGFIIVDMHKIMGDKLSEIAQSNLSEESQKAELKVVSAKLKHAIRELHIRTQKTILLKDVVLAGAVDETDHIMETMAK